MLLLFFTRMLNTLCLTKDAQMYFLQTFIYLKLLIFAKSSVLTVIRLDVVCFAARIVFYVFLYSCVG